VRNLRWEIITGRYTESTCEQRPDPALLLPHLDLKSADIAQDSDHARAEIVQEFHSSVYRAEKMQATRDPRLNIRLHLDPLIEQHDPLLATSTKLNPVMLQTLQLIEEAESKESLKMTSLAGSVSWAHLLATRVTKDDGSTIPKLLELQVGFQRDYESPIQRTPWLPLAQLHTILCLWYHHLVLPQCSDTNQGEERGSMYYLRVLGRWNEFKCLDLDGSGHLADWIGYPLMLCPLPDSNPIWDLAVAIKDYTGPFLPVFGMSRPSLYK
jgi:hypothetical protein